MSKSEMQPSKMDALVQMYIKIREKKSQLKAEYEAKVAQFTEAQDKIEALLLAKFAELGVDSIKTAAGTAYTSVRTSASIGDWDAYLAFLKSQGDEAWDFIERRPSKAAVEQFRSANDDLPPGINWSETRTVNFRKG